MIKRITTTNQDSHFMQSIRGIQLRHTSVQTSSSPATYASVPPDPNAKGKKKIKSILTSPATSTPPLASPLKSKICCFFNCTDGCKKSESDCSRMHRDPKDANDEKELDSFFKKFTKFTKK